MTAASGAWLFASDLHLSDETPQILTAFENWLEAQAAPSTHIVLLGDLFEHWVGDDHSSDCIERVASALQQASAIGATCHFMHGNRDFMLGADYMRRATLHLLPDPCFIDLFGTPTVLTHGDLLCTDDIGYQQFRKISRDPLWQYGMLQKPLSTRQQIAASITHTSRQQKALKSELIMDVSPPAVLAVFDGWWPGDDDQPSGQQVRRIIHGHTHRPGRYVEKRPDCERIVLPDWDYGASPPRGGYLRIAADCQSGELHKVLGRCD
ncbi:MAG: UDP-2,3-diacylglucosamine diphosphatase [Burkholderiaceae bacterium]|jgi:UDP-2,3-diacylglucosamine hydrolase